MANDQGRGTWRRQGERIAALAGVVVMVGLLGWILLLNVRGRAQTRANATGQALALTAGLATVQAQSTAVGAQQATVEAQTATAQRAARQATADQRATATAAAQAVPAAATVQALAQRATAAAEAAAIESAQAATATALAQPTPALTAATLVAGTLAVAPIPEGEIGQRRAAYGALVGSLKLVRNETFDSARTKERWNENPNGVGDARRFKGSYQLSVAPGGAPNADYWKEQRLGASYVVELDVSLPTPGTWAGIVFDAAPDGSADRVFAVSDAGSWQLIARRNGQIDPATSTAAQASGAIGGGSQVNTLRVLRSPDELQVWANNTPLAVIAAGRAGGRVGVVGFADGRLGEAAIVHVDNFKVWTP